MKNLVYIFCVLGLALITSCGKDDGEGLADIGLTGVATFDGNAISITHGLFGETAEQGAYGATFFLADGPLSFDAETEEASFQGEVLISVIIFSEGNSFESGTYSAVDFSSNDIADKSAIIIVADANNASSGGGFATGGTVNIQGSGNSFTLTFDLDFANDVKLTGNVSGGFEIIDLDAQ